MGWWLWLGKPGDPLPKDLMFTPVTATPDYLLLWSWVFGVRSPSELL
jgi:hypothetical protein